MPLSYLYSAMLILLLLLGQPVAAALAVPSTAGGAESGKEASASSSNVKQQPAASKNAAKTRAKTTPSSKKKKKPADKVAHGNAHGLGQTLRTSAWYLDGTPRRGRGAVWEHGIPLQSLLRKRTPLAGTLRSKQGTASLDTQKGIHSALDTMEGLEAPPSSGLSMDFLNKPGAPQFRVTREESSWRNPVAIQDGTGHEVMSTRRNVVGAYADVVRSDDLHVSVGPELHIPDTDKGITHLSPQWHDTNALGIGMKWQWDF